MRFRWCSVLVVAMPMLLSVGFALSCSSSSTPSVAAVAAEPSSSPDAEPMCSNGAAYSSATVFPELDHAASIPERECVARCGDTTVGYWGAGGGPTATVSALPSGSCSAEEPCAMQAVRLFCQSPSSDGGSVLSPVGALMQFVCQCSDNQWLCSGSYLSGGAGTYPPCPDADGRDAGG